MVIVCCIVDVHTGACNVTGANSGDMIFAINLASGRYSDERTISRCSAQVYSQNGEDGMIAEIFRRIGLTNKFFVEFGIGDGLENNTRLLLELGWHGIWIDGDEAFVDGVRAI